MTSTSTPSSHQAEKANLPGAKITACQATAVMNCATSKPRASALPLRSLPRRTASAAACNAHKVNQAAGNAQSGGIHDGFTSDSKNVTYPAYESVESDARYTRVRLHRFDNQRNAAG